jgi:hypothetical protein
MVCHIMMYFPKLSLMQDETKTTDESAPLCQGCQPRVKAGRMCISGAACISGGARRAADIGEDAIGLDQVDQAMFKGHKEIRE